MSTPVGRHACDPSGHPGRPEPGRSGYAASDSSSGREPESSVIVVAYGVDRVDLGWIPDKVPVFVVHNDDQLSERACGHPSTRHLYPGANLGFGRGVNLALTEVRTRRVVIVNPDVELNGRHWDALASGRGDQLVTVPLVGVDGDPMASVLPYPSAAMLTASSLQLIRLAPPGSIRRRVLATLLGAWGDERRWSVRTPPGHYPLDSSWIPGAVLAVDTDLLRQIGGFDARYFLYLEDTDLCRRMARHVPGAVAVVADTEPGFHEIGGSAHTPAATRLVRQSQWDSATTYATREQGWQWRCAALAIRGGSLIDNLGMDLWKTTPPGDGRWVDPRPRRGRSTVMRPAPVADGGDGRQTVEAVVVTYNPELPRLATALGAVVTQVERVTVVDNGSANLPALRSLVADRSTVELVELGDNRGIAAALNVAVQAALSGRRCVDWLLTLDQDTVIYDHSVTTILESFGELAVDLRASCAVVAMRHSDPEELTGIWRWVDRRAVEVATYGAFREVRAAITSGNLVRMHAVGELRFDEELFMDQVDTAWCALLRRSGWKVLEHTQPLMDHQLGTSIRRHGRSRLSWSDQRLYYIARNSSVLLGRGDVPIRLYVVQLASQVRTQIWAGGPTAVPRTGAILALALLDAVSGRMGRREYRLTRGPRHARCTQGRP